MLNSYLWTFPFVWVPASAGMAINHIDRLYALPARNECGINCGGYQGVTMTFYKSITFYELVKSYNIPLHGTVTEITF